MNLNKIVSTSNMTRDEWLSWRQKGIGGSDAAAICGVSKYKSSVELWMEKTGLSSQNEAGEAAYWGTVLEPIIRNEFVKRTGLEVEIIPYLLQHPNYPFMLANLDGIVNDPVKGHCIFEAKTASSFKAQEWENGIPDEYMLQLQHYLSVTDCSGAYISVLIGGNQFKWSFIERDEELINMILRLESSFWDMVTSQTPPPIDGTEASSSLLNKLYPKSSTGSKLILPEDTLALPEEYDLAVEREKIATESKELIANQLKQLLGDYESGQAANRVVSWKSIETERLNSKKLKEESPEIYAKYTTKTCSRKFSVK